MANEFEYKKMMAALADKINSAELDKMKYLCSGRLNEKGTKINAKMRESIKKPTDLWEILEERKLLGPTNLTLLKEMLQSCTDGRQDVLDLVYEFERGGSSMDATPCPSGQRRVYSGPDLRKEVSFLVKYLGNSWRFFIRSLGVQEEEIDIVAQNHPHDVREQIHQLIWIWLYTEQENASKLAFENACQDIRRKDLAHKLATNQY